MDDLGTLSLPELLELLRSISEEIELRIMEMEGEISIKKGVEL